MGKEIEHKYLVKNNSFRDIAEKSVHIIQGYISRDRERVVRVRIFDSKAFLTVKGANKGDSRDEYEYEIPIGDAKEMINNLCLPGVIDKIRHIVNYNGNIWEIDEFKGNLDGLIIAEIEIPYSEYKYSLPSFIGKNVTGDPQYYNSNISNLLK